MKKLLLILSILFLLQNFCFGQNVYVNNDSTKQAAITAGNSWLDMVSKEQYGESWEEAALFLKNAVTKEQWKQALVGLIPPFGVLISREVVSAQYATSLPGAPDGEYVVITYKTKFEKKEKAIETVTPVKCKDGIWRVSGYFIK